MNAPADRPPVNLARMTSPQVPSDAVLLIPLGSTEQHGPHLPLDTDTRIAAGVAQTVAADPAPPLRRGQVLVAPALPVGSSGEHHGFAGTLSIGAAVTELMLIELIRSATEPGGGPFQAVLIVNGHGGNAAAVVNAVRTLEGEGRRVAGWAPNLPRADAHAGYTETSLGLHLFPDLVRTEAMAAGSLKPVRELMAQLRAGGVAAVSPNGVLGDPAGASADAGAALFAHLVLDAHGALGDLLNPSGNERPASE